MASYPNSIYSPREKENKSGIVYDADKKTSIFAEDIVKDDDEIVAVETELGTNPKGAYDSVKDYLADLLSKVNEALARPAVWDDYIYLSTLIESLDGWKLYTSGTGSSNLNEYRLNLATGATQDSISNARDETRAGILWTWARDKKVRINAYLYNVADVDLRFGMGFMDITPGIKFRIYDSHVWGFVSNGSDYTLTDFGAISTGYHTFEIKFTAGSKAEFFVDGASVGEITTYLPTGTSGAEIPYFIEISNVTAANKQVNIYSCEHYQALT